MYSPPLFTYNYNFNFTDTPQPQGISNPEIELEQQWDEVSPQLSAVLEGTVDIPTDVVPFDAGSDVPIDDQK